MVGMRLSKKLKIVLIFPEEKVSLDKAACEINAYLQENILKPMGVTMFRAGDVYGYCGFTSEEIQLVKAETMPINDLKSSFSLMTYRWSYNT